MKAILFLLVIIFIYYQIYYRIPYFIPYTYHIYFWISVGIYLLIYYILTYQRPFAVQMMTNMNDASNKPLYDFKGKYYKENQMNLLKNNLAMRQGWRCLNCQNPILNKDIHDYHISYIRPLQFGGENNISNIGLSCPTCNSFKPY